MFKCGFVAIIGRPNVGKSSLLNAIIGEKIAAVTAKPQTTRNRITGIHNDDEAQIIFIDTPGIHQATSLFNRSLVGNALGALKSIDAILLVFDAVGGVTKGEENIILSLQVPVIAVINKIDKVPKPALLPLIAKISSASPSLPFAAIIPVSALRKQGIAPLLARLKGLLPSGEPCFPKDHFTEKSERFIAQEIILEQVFLHTRQEVPYSAAVTIDSFREDEAKGLLSIAATIHLEKSSQKGIVIGKGGAMLKKIGGAARHELEKFFATRVFLETLVRVQKDWTHNPRLLKEFGISE